MFSDQQPEVVYVRNAKLLRVIDGDTFEVFIDDGRGCWGKERIRLFGVDTPEMRGAEKIAGSYVTKRAIEWLDFPNKTDVVINSLEFKVDSFARIICELWIDKKSYNRWLLEEKLAWPTDSKGKPYDRDIASLNLPNEIKQVVNESYG